MLAIANMSAAKKRHPEMMVSLSMSDEVYLPGNWKVESPTQTDPKTRLGPFQGIFYRVCLACPPSTGAPVTGLPFPYFQATLQRNTAFASTGEVQDAFHESAGENSGSHIQRQRFVPGRSPNEQLAKPESVGPKSSRVSSRRSSERQRQRWQQHWVTAASRTASSCPLFPHRRAPSTKRRA